MLAIVASTIVFKTCYEGIVSIKMSKRKLKRQLNLAQIVMLGAGGTIAAEIFVLTGHAAGIAGPAAVLAILLGGLLSYSVALNYCELSTAFPVAGGAMTYVREAFGNNVLSFMVGSMDCLSSTFYAALSAVGFAYSLQVFFPFLRIPIILTAVIMIGLFTVLNLLGVSMVGNAQVVLGGIMLLIFAAYIVFGFVHPAGFSWQVFSAGGIFIHERFWDNLAMMMATVALTYNAYVGFEVIADDAEEVKNPARTLPVGILISLTICTVVYVSVALVTLGTIPWQQLAGSETALTDAVVHFMPGWGMPLMAVAGMIATLTSINSAMLSATREAFTLSRDGAWPRAFSRLTRLRTPYVAILVIGGVSALVAAVGLVDFLSYISSAGYLFVLFWASLSMIRLRKLYPNLQRPFKAPLFPLTAYTAAAAGFLIIAFSDWRALLFGAGVLALCALYYYLYQPIARMVVSNVRTFLPAKNRILVPVANPRTAKSLVHLGSILAQASEETSICVMTVASISPSLSPAATKRAVDLLEVHQKALLADIGQNALEKNVPLYTKMRTAPSVSQGILDELEMRNNVGLLLAGWPGPLNGAELAENPVNVAVQRAHTNVAVLLDRGLRQVRQILVPVGGGPHSRLALRLAYEIAEQEKAKITALHTFPRIKEVEEIEDEMLTLREIIEDELGSVTTNIVTRVIQADSVPKGILAETSRQSYDLVVIGASDEWALNTRLFGSVTDWVAEKVRCSVLMVRRYEPMTLAWFRRQVKSIEKEYTNPTKEEVHSV